METGNLLRRITSSTISTEHQIGHSGNFSVTKIKGHWTFKAGGQFQVIAANFTDRRVSANLGGCCASDESNGPSYTAQYINATGAPQMRAVPTMFFPSNNGFAGAMVLVNEGVWFIRPGANLKPAYASKYFAFIRRTTGRCRTN